MFHKIKDSFLSLLRMGLWMENNEPLSQFPLTDEEWTLIYDLAVGQTVEGIVYEGVLMLPEEYMPPYETLLRWTVRIDGVERYNTKMRHHLSILGAGLEKNNIPFILLKGLGLAENYIKPRLRVSGDVDLYFPSQRAFEQANNLLKSKGCEISKGDHNSVFYTFNSIEVEHHTKMIDVFNPFCQKTIKNLIEREQSKVQELNIEGQKIPIPSYLLSQIQANAHILKHYLGFGIGLRQLCDVARLCHVKDENFDGEELRLMYKKLGLGKWMDVIHSFLVYELGLKSSKLPYTISGSHDTKSILNDVLHSGNFGFHDIRFQKEDSKISERYGKRDHVLKRVMPHILKLMNWAPGEVIWYPLNKAYTKISGK